MGKQDRCQAQQQSGYWKGYPCSNEPMDNQDYCFVHYGMLEAGKLCRFEKVKGRWKRFKLDPKLGGSDG